MVPDPLTIKMIGLVAIQSRDCFSDESKKRQVCLDLSDFMCPYFWASISGLKKDLLFSTLDMSALTSTSWT